MRQVWGTDSILHPVRMQKTGEIQKKRKIHRGVRVQSISYVDIEPDSDPCIGIFYML